MNKQVLRLLGNDFYEDLTLSVCVLVETLKKLVKLKMLTFLNRLFEAIYIKI